MDPNLFVLNCNMSDCGFVGVLLPCLMPHDSLCSGISRVTMYSIDRDGPFKTQLLFFRDELYIPLGTIGIPVKLI